MVLLKIGTTDITSYIDEQNCKFNKVDVFEAWTDGNGIEHRNISRTRITGKAAAGFTKAADFSAFCTLIENSKQTDGYFSVTAYVNNTNSTETFNAYIGLSAGAKWDWINSRQWIEVELTITQR